MRSERPQLSAAAYGASPSTRPGPNNPSGSPSGSSNASAVPNSVRPPAVTQHTAPTRTPRPHDVKHVDFAIARRVYREMVRTRYVDERLTALQRQGRIGFHVGSMGEEAAIVGAAAGLREQDWIFPCYREIGSLLWRGFPLQTFIDNMYGNADDVAKGRQMPNHTTAKAYRYASVSATIGTQITHAVGFAWAAKLRKEDLVSVSFFGDGATSSSDFHAGMNFAAVFKVPTLFLCRNNGFAISVPFEKQMATKTIAEKAAAYGMLALACDGNDAIEVIQTVRRGVEHASSGKGPVLIELNTYRLGGHSTSDDPTAYRADAELKEHQKDDPIPRLRRVLAEAGEWSDALEQTLLKEIDAEFRACVEAAENKPKPALDTLFTDVYRDQPQHLREQQDECEQGPRARAKPG